MTKKTQPESAKPKRSDEPETRSRRSAAWDERLRLVGDARFVEVEWSGRDDPSWPLPVK
jgi:hypothetical protein